MSSLMSLFNPVKRIEKAGEMLQSHPMADVMGWDEDEDKDKKKKKKESAADNILTAKGANP